MPCYSPLQAWRGSVGPSGKRSVVFVKARAKGFASELSLPCGQCIGCRLERSRQWAMRCVHESELYERNCFLTLTYDDTHLPKNGSVDVRDFQLFMKRLRKAYSSDRIRFFHCGEYGERLGRPHYHACLFNFDFDDKVLWSIRNGNSLYRSDSLDRIWGQGHAVIGDVTFDSAAYVARYIMKKITGNDSEAHYDGRRPEYITMSRRPGIGRGWYDKYKGDIYPVDFAVVRGVKVRPPKFYDGLYELENAVDFERLKKKRVSRVVHLVPLIDRLAGKSDFVKDCTPDRLKVKEFVKKDKIKSLIRPMEGLHES